MRTGTRPLRRRVLHLAGTISLGIGILLFVWAFVVWKWNDPVTAVYTHWQQRKLENRYETLAASFPEVVAPVASASRAGPVAERRSRQQVQAIAGRYRTAATVGQPIGRIRVPRLGLDMIVVDGTDRESLKKGPGWDSRTYMPGAGQLVYIAGHRTTYAAPFARIDRMRKGDLVEITVPYGRFRYRVSRSVIVPADDLSRLRSGGSEVLALQACHPRFSARQRYIVYARPAG